MTHEQARGLILAEQVEPLGDKTRRELHQHLSACPPCGEYAQQVERGLAAFRSHAVLADDELVRRTRARLLRERVPGQTPSPAWPWVPVVASLVACLSLASSFLLTRRLVLACHDTLGVAISIAAGCAAAAWLLAWALGALATVAVSDRLSVVGRGGHPRRSATESSGRA
ncbi:MAG: hypothetical protein LJF30_01740 [Acidobacteria bacterium]|nr:hypothetical protein [Acidobacteriota bacterium]